LGLSVVANGPGKGKHLMNDTVPNETALQEEVQLLLQAKPARLLHFGFFLISAVLVWGSVTFVPDFLGLEPLGRQNLSQVLFVHYGTFFVLLWGGLFCFSGPVPIAATALAIGSCNTQSGATGAV
jgi:hypothetical protein